MTQQVQVDVQVAAAVSNVPARSDIQAWLEQVIAHVGRDTKRNVEVSVRIVDETEGRILNNQFRQQDRATNVLSFPLAAESLTDLPDELPLQPIYVKINRLQ